MGAQGGQALSLSQATTPQNRDSNSGLSGPKPGLRPQCGGAFPLAEATWRWKEN